MDDTDNCDSAGMPPLKRLKLESASKDEVESVEMAVPMDSNGEDNDEKIFEEYITLIKDDHRLVVEKQLEQIMEEYYLKHGGVLYDFYLWKKKFTLKHIVDEILLWFQQSNLGNFAENALKLLETNLLAEQNLLYPPNIIEPIFHEALSRTSISSIPKPKEILAQTDVASFLKPANLPNTQAITSDINSGIPIGNGATQRKSSSQTTSGLLEEPAPSLDIYEKAKQEAAVMARIEELKKAGMWSVKRLPKVKDLDRKKVHWDYVLEEVQWLATDFESERKWKKRSAKVCGGWVKKFIISKENEAVRLEKEEKLKLKKIAQNISKMVRNFWNEIGKIVETKQDLLLKEKLKKVQDMQLKMIVEKADLLTEGMTSKLNVIGPGTSSAASLEGSCTEEEMDKNDGDFTVKEDDDSDDDEEHITKDEDQAEENELELLQKEENMDFDDLASLLPPGYLESLAYGKDQPPPEDEDEKEDVKDVESKAKVKVENEPKLKVKEDGDDCKDHDDDDDKDNDETEDDEDDEDDETTSKADTQEETETETDAVMESANEGMDEEDDNDSLKYLVDEKKEESKTNTDLVAAEAEAIQPKGYTFSLVEVRTKLPKLIKYSLREYQHIGLDWLVAMFEKNLNGILADEMGLGKTIQTISLLAHLACDRQIWGPHLIIVPTSVMLNWEMELKKWSPGLKVLTYYGTPKERRMKRTGWTKPNSFHVCITSYKLAVQDHSVFRRKKWVYLILDEAQHIKNFKSQRWQMLLNFNTDRRLLLTGTPLQNNLMDLWSLMHFLMPNVFDSHKEFKDWFVNPVTGMAEGNQEKNEELIRRLHRILRPFLLRRLKADVEKQMPKKYEHIIKCSLSKRQRTLYEEFMGLSKTKDTLASGNFLSVINVLMQLRKVCNHPNLFDPRPAVSPFIQDSLEIVVPELFQSVLDHEPLADVCLESFQLVFSQLTKELTRNDELKSQYYQYKQSHMTKALNQKPQVYARLNDYKDFYRYFCDFKTLNDVDSVTLIERPSVFSACLDNDLDLEDFQKENIPVKDQYYGFGQLAEAKHSQQANVIESEKLARLAKLNRIRCSRRALFHNDSVRLLDFSKVIVNDDGFGYGHGSVLCYRAKCRDNYERATNILEDLVKSPDEFELDSRDVTSRFQCIVPNVIASPLKVRISHTKPFKICDSIEYQKRIEAEVPLAKFDLLHSSRLNQRVLLPETRLIQYDCGKLHMLDDLLCKLKAGKHRVLIFTQMSKMLDIFEQFLNYHGHTYLRLDGSTKIEQRQILMERFNSDPKIFCFILSTRSGGVGINLTGADTVIFYDSDWNPTMDAQAQDRCHRIGQTRDVHIYRLISEKTIEENILKKAQQKKFMADIAIEEGNFNSAFFNQGAIKDLFNTNYASENDDAEDAEEGAEDGRDVAAFSSALEQALGTVEDQNDVIAARNLKRETAGEFAEFDENIPLEDREDDDRNVEVEQLNEFIGCLLPVEQYAIQALENTKDFSELKQADEDFEETKRNYKRSIEEFQQTHEENRRKLLEEMNDDMLTCSREEATKPKVDKSSNKPTAPARLTRASLRLLQDN